MIIQQNVFNQLFVDYHEHFGPCGLGGFRIQLTFALVSVVRGD